MQTRQRGQLWSGSGVERARCAASGPLRGSCTRASSRVASRCRAAEKTRGAGHAVGVDVAVCGGDTLPVCHAGAVAVAEQ